MDFLKKHYEKIILIVVLLGSVAAAAFMLVQLNQERQRTEEQKLGLLAPRIKELQPTDLSTNVAALERASTETDVTLARNHNLFNPVKWQQRRDGALIKIQTGAEIGVSAAEVTAINPLHLVVELERVHNPETSPSYVVRLRRETERSRGLNRRTVSVGQTTPDFRLLSVVGPPEDPEALNLLLEGETEPIRVGKDEPYQRVIGHTADLRYPPENRAFKDLRKGDKVTLADETYNIVAINESEVVLSASSNQKQTVIPVSANARPNQ